jgi:hypothetical protein
MLKVSLLWLVTDLTSPVYLDFFGSISAGVESTTNYLETRTLGEREREREREREYEEKAIVAQHTFRELGWGQRSHSYFFFTRCCSLAGALPSQEPFAARLDTPSGLVRNRSKAGKNKGREKLYLLIHFFES